MGQTDEVAPLVLVLNAGSSSLKITAYSGERLELRAMTERTNHGAGSRSFKLVDNERCPILLGFTAIPENSSLLQIVVNELALRFPGRSVTAIGHRVVHGGSAFTAPTRITPAVISQLEALIPLAPLHQPHHLAEIRAAMALLPDVPQVACFDTAFHASMPRLERMLGLPRSFYEQGIQRYGFHGLSYQSIADRLPTLDPVAATGRTVVCHLGSGASLCALLAGQSIATTMSFTPLDGLLMSTRAGAIDPGVILYLLRQLKMTSEQVEHLLDRESGLLGISGISPDIRDLQANPAPEAAEAIDLFCYRIVREIGAMVAALEGLDAIVFTAGIGENSALVREKVCDRLKWLGVQLDLTANHSDALRLNQATSRVTILRIPADEEVVIARDAIAAITD